MAEIRFDGRVAIVTGAGGGLGRTYALLLASRGAKVVVNDLGGAADGTGSGSAMADQVVEEIKAAGGEAVANYDGVDTAEGGANIVKTAVDAFGKVDILINNAGILRDKSFIKMEEETWDKIYAVHVKGAYYVTKAAFPIMKVNGYGRILMTTSAAGLYGNFGQTNYGSAKMALVGFMSSLKLEGQKYNVLVNTLAPFAGSRLTATVMPPDILEKLAPEMIAPAVAYLTSEACQETGIIISAGGGYFARAAVVEGPGHTFASGEEITIEKIRDAMDSIKTLEGAKEFGNATEAGGAIFQSIASV